MDINVVNNNHDMAKDQIVDLNSRAKAQADVEQQKDEEAVKASAPVADIAKEEIETAVAGLNDFVQSQGRQLSFAFDESHQRSIIKVVDSDSGDVIRQIPSEDVLKLSERLNDLQSDVGAAVGVLFNKAV